MADGKSIFIVEDEPMIGLILEDFLDGLGYQVCSNVDQLAEACLRAREGGFDAAILDCHLGDEQVWPVADILQEKGIPFLFATGGSSDEVPDRFGPCPTLEKPFTMANVENALERLFQTVM